MNIGLVFSLLFGFKHVIVSYVIDQKWSQILVSSYRMSTFSMLILRGDRTNLPHLEFRISTGMKRVTPVLPDLMRTQHNFWMTSFEQFTTWPMGPWEVTQALTHHCLEEQAGITFSVFGESGMMTMTTMKLMSCFIGEKKFSSFEFESKLTITNFL